jgi:peptidoglycan/xylan/chitin deacetylase (PgdA/CDA1 family)
MSEAKRVSVLMYHRVGDAHNDWEARYTISPETFTKHMQALSRAGYQGVSIDDMVDWMEGKASLPMNAILITFDDGFRGVRDHALPVLEEMRWPFTVFLVSDLIGGSDEWTRSSNPLGVTYPLLDTEEIHDMQNRGCEFHSHTRSHPSLPKLDDGQLADQLGGSRDALSRLLGHEVRYLAYPFGHMNDRVVAAAEAAGYRAAFTTKPGFNRKGEPLLRIRRLDVYGTDSPAMLLRKIRLGTNEGGVSQVFRYYMDRVLHRVTGQMQ